MAQVDARNESAACTSTFDLTTTFMKYLDPQLSLLMIDFIAEKNVCVVFSHSPHAREAFCVCVKHNAMHCTTPQLYPAAEMAVAKAVMLLKTRCVAKAEEAVAKLKEQGVDAAQQSALSGKLKAMKEESAKEKEAATQLWEAQKGVFESEALKELLARAKSEGARSDAAPEGDAETESAVPAPVVDMKTLTTVHSVTPAALAALHRYAQYQYSAGEHAAALALLQQLLELTAYFGETGEVAELRARALWGQLACDVLLGRTAAGAADVAQLRESIEAQARQQPRTVSSLQLLHMRVWLLHWALFVFLGGSSAAEGAHDGRERLIDLYQNTVYMNAIQTEAPHLLRYFVVAVITDTRKQRSNKEVLARNVRQCAYMYADSLTRFVDSMNYADFDGALAALTACREQVFPNDMFVAPLEGEFVQNARRLLFENYVCVHRRIDVPTLASKLSMSEKEVEHWVVDLIRTNSHLDARIDSAANTMLFGTQQQSVYQNVIEVTKEITEKAETLLSYVALFEQTGTVPSVTAGRYRRF